MTPTDDARTADFTATASSVREARTFVGRAVEELGGVSAVDQAVLLTSELATNAVLHAQSSYTVTVTRTGARLRVAVADRSSDRPQRRHFGTTAGTGRGIAMVEEISADWGVDRVGTGKVVWFELDTAAGGAGRAAAYAGSASAREDAIDLEAVFQQFPDVESDRGPQNLVGAGR